MRDRVLPDQIHNFAHNNEWLIRNLVKVGRVNDALDLAKNMFELPRHPKYNTLERGSTKYGRERLQLVLKSYRLWPELIDLSETMYLEPTDKQPLQIERQRDLGVAYALNGQADQSAEILASLGLELEARQAATVRTRKRRNPMRLLKIKAVATARMRERLRPIANAAKRNEKSRRNHWMNCRSNCRNRCNQISSCCLGGRGKLDQCTSKHGKIQIWMTSS